MPLFNVFSRNDQVSSDTWIFRGTTMADNEMEAIDHLAKEDAKKKNIAEGNICTYAAVRSAYWRENEYKFEVTPHRVGRNEALDNAEEPAKI